MAIDRAKFEGAKYIVKGVRTTQDFDYERLINDVSLTQQRGVETVLLFSDHRLSHISSSAVKELSKYVGVINDMVTPTVRRALDLKSGRRIVGVTGTIGSGKSTLCRKLTEEIHSSGLDNLNYIDLDVVGRALSREDSPMANEVRTKVFETFGTTDRKQLGEIVFGDTEKLKKLNGIYREPMLTVIRSMLSQVQGNVLLEGALLLEFGWEFLCSSGTVILVKTPPRSEHVSRLVARGHTDDQIDRRLSSQLTFEEKLELANAAIRRSDLTNVITYDSTSKNGNLYELLREVSDGKYS